ncbi:glycoside hydrolase family 15 protein, partial [Rhizobium ruizarguesonis]
RSCRGRRRARSFRRGTRLRLMVGRRDDALRLFERLLSICNDVGLLAEEYDPAARRMLGNFPQALSHIGLINSALNLA